MTNISEWAERGGAVKSVPPPPTFSRGGGIGRGGSNMDACEPHATPFVSVLWLLDRSASYFIVSTFHFLHESSRLLSCIATLPGSHKHTFSPAFATWRIYLGPSNASSVRTLFHIVRRRRNKLGHQVVASERWPWPFVTSLREVRASVCLISGASKR